MSLTPPSVNPTTPTPEAAESSDSSPAPSTPVTTTSSHSGSHFGITSNGIRLTVCSLSGYTWPTELILDLGKSNWIEWSDELHLLTLQQGLDPWLDGSLAIVLAELTYLFTAMLSKPVPTLTAIAVNI